jgi:hypothetical protein
MNTENPVVPNYGTGDLCGTPTTPQCPIQELYLARNALIYQIAGSKTDRERLRLAAERVDAYLIGALHSALALTVPLDRRTTT